MSEATTRVLHVCLLGNPNTGKTTLLNRLCGLRHKTGNFPGTTQEARVGTVGNSGLPAVRITDLPGIYSLELASSESEVCREVLSGRTSAPGTDAREPDAVCIVVDATNLERNLLIVGEVLRRRLPTVVALNMVDLARKLGTPPDEATLSEQLGARVVPICARSGDGLPALVQALQHASIPTQTPPGTQAGLEAWTTSVATAATLAAQRKAHAGDTGAQGKAKAKSRMALTDAIDRVATHPLGGLAMFVGVMFALFYAIFALAQIPMGLIEAIFGWSAERVQKLLGDGLLADFIAGGVLGGLGGTLVFLPQIMLLFFLISLLEDTGYLARAAFVADRFMRPFGLSGYAFVPLLSSHACALPGIMATRTIPDRKERLAAILVAPFMSCSARIPVYVLLTALLFPGKPGQQALAFLGCYALGAAAGLLSSLVARRTIARGASRELAMELPTYKRPSVRTAMLSAWDRGLLFVKKAGTIILAISMVLWWLSSFPKQYAPSPAAAEARERAAMVLAGADALPTAEREAAQQQHDALQEQAEHLEASHHAAQTFAGRIGRFVQPVFEPLGYDWRLSIGVMTSFAAREVFASTMAVVATGKDDAEDEGVLRAIKELRRDDGVTLAFTTATAWSLLVYYVLAMQCLPTLAVTARESGHWKWAVLQLVWMCGLAYLGAMVVYWVAR
jgi:ferrous iron transport protein B